MQEGDIRYDHILLAMVDEVGERLGRTFADFMLFGFSGGGHFAHRFFYLHPQRLSAVSIGAPGAVTLIDDQRDYWVGTRDLAARFGTAIDLPAMRKGCRAARGRRGGISRRGDQLPARQPQLHGRHQRHRAHPGRAQHGAAA